MNGKKYVLKGSAVAAPNPGSGDVRIVVLQRGWVVVGDYKENADDVLITNASVIRKWGTSKGLGELIIGPLSDTVLDYCGNIKTAKLGVCFTLDCEASKWNERK